MNHNNVPAVAKGFEIRPIGQQTMRTAPAAAAFLGIQPKSLAEAMELAKLIAYSNLCPDAFFEKPGDVLIVGGFAAELGISWLQGIFNTFVVNRRPALYGDIMFGLLQNCPHFEDLVDIWDPATRTATCRIKRRNRLWREASFSFDDAKAAGFLDGKNAHTYKKFLRDMLTWKARWRAARPEFADVFHGMYIVEEAMDLPPPGEVVGQEPIIEPQALPAGLVDDFLGMAKERKPAAGAPRQPGPSNADPSADYAKPTMITDVVEHSYKDQKTKETKVFWKIHTSDGRAGGTFKEGVRDTARQAMTESIPSIVDMKPANRPGTWNVTEILFAPPVKAEAPASEPDPADDAPDEDGPPDA